LVVSSLDIEICGVTTRDISCHDDAIGRISYVGRRHTPCSGLLAWGLTPDLLGLLQRLLLGYLSSLRFLLDRLLDDILLSARLDGSLNGLSDDAFLNSTPDGLLDDTLPLDTLSDSTLNRLLDDAFLDGSLDRLLDDAFLDGSLNRLLDDTFLNSTPDGLLDDTFLNSTPDGLLDDTFFNGSLNGLLDDTLPLDTPLDWLLLGDSSLSLRCYLIRVSSRLSFSILHSRPPLVIVTVLTLVLVPS
jgi:hypothetical protein